MWHISEPLSKDQDLLGAGGSFSRACCAPGIVGPFTGGQCASVIAAGMGLDQRRPHSGGRRQRLFYRSRAAALYPYFVVGVRPLVLYWST
jgi:hypothetical protein